MLIALYYIIANIIANIISSLILPTTMAMKDFAQTIALVIIVIIGIKIGLGSIGVHTSGRTIERIIGGIVDIFLVIFQNGIAGIGWAIGKVIQGVKWLIQKVTKVVPTIYSKSKNFYISKGANSITSTILAVLTVVVFIAIII